MAGGGGLIWSKTWVFELSGHLGPLGRPMEGHVDFYHTNFSRRSHPRHPEFLPLSRMSKADLLTASLGRLWADSGMTWADLGPTLDRLWANFELTLARLWADCGPTLRQLLQGGSIPDNPYRHAWMGILDPHPGTYSIPGGCPRQAPF